MNYRDYNDYELLYMIKEDNEEAINIMIYKYDPLVKKIAFSFYNNFKGVSLEDMVQEGRVALFNTFLSYQDNYNVLFYSYAYKAIKNAIYNLCNKACRYKRKSNINTSELDVLYDAGYVIDYENIIMDIEYSKKIESFKNSLKFSDSLIFELRYNGFSYMDISILLDISVKKVDNTIYGIKKKLKKYFVFS